MPACVSRGVIASMFPLHDRVALEALRKKWVKTLFTPQPLGEPLTQFRLRKVEFLKLLSLTSLLVSRCKEIPMMEEEIGFAG